MPSARIAAVILITILLCAGGFAQAQSLTEKMRLAAKKFHNYFKRICLGMSCSVLFNPRHFFGIPRRYPKFPKEILAAALRAKSAKAFFGLRIGTTFSPVQCEYLGLDLRGG